MFQKAEILAENRGFPLGFRLLFRFRIEYRAIENWVVWTTIKINKHVVIELKEKRLINKDPDPICEVIIRVGAPK